MDCLIDWVSASASARISSLSLKLKWAEGRPIPKEIVSHGAGVNRAARHPADRKPQRDQ
jgi:hypothetical protein